MLSCSNHIISAYVNIGSYDYSGCGANVGGDRFFYITYNNSNKSSFINSNQSKVGLGWLQNAPLITSAIFCMFFCWNNKYNIDDVSRI